jgi:hypothetical protein
MRRAGGAETWAMSSSPSIAAGARAAAGSLVRVPAWLVLVAWVGMASLLQLVRAPGLPEWSVLWTEDGSVFLQQALVRSFPDALTTTSAGYLHVVPRLLVEPASWFPLGAAPAIIAVGSAAAAALLAAYVWVATRTIFDTPRARALVVALFLLAPPAAIELSGSAANFHWYGLFASFCALLHRPATRREAAAATAVVALTALSDPMLALLLPLLVLRPGGLLRAQLGARLIPAAAVAGLAVQGVVILGAAGPEGQSAFSALDLPAIYAQRVAGPALLGDSWFGRLWLSIGWPAAWIALALLAALVIRAATSGTAERRRHAVLAAAGSLLLFSVPLAIRGTAEMVPVTGALFAGGARYTYVPLLLAWVPLLLLADRRDGSGRHLATLFVIVVATASMGVTDRSLGPDWADTLSAARRACAAGAVTVRPRIAPISSTWRVTLPCSRL